MSDPLDIEPPAATPVVISQRAAPEVFLTLLRYVLTLLGGTLLVKRGFMTDTDLQEVIGAILMLAPIIWAAVRTKQNHTVKVTLADKLPDRDAIVKRP